MLLTKGPPESIDTTLRIDSTLAEPLIAFEFLFLCCAQSYSRGFSVWLEFLQMPLAPFFFNLTYDAPIRVKCPYWLPNAIGAVGYDVM